MVTQSLSSSSSTNSLSRPYHDGRDHRRRSRLAWNIKNVKVGRGSNTKQILTDIVGESQPGQVTAIMGASGSGKTTLLECISLRSPVFKGAVYHNGRPAKKSFFTESALVYQQELFCPFLTVYEHLIFHGTARMLDKFSVEEIEERIDQIIVEMGLAKCRNTLVGGGLTSVKGLSGGERKRLSIATELLLCPSILFLDEPTTSVDSVMAENIVALLQHLAHVHGTMILATIHGPSSQIFRHFSHLLLLTNDGRLAFHGSVSQALKHVSIALGKPLPEAYNPADHFIKLVVNSPHTLNQKEEVISDGMPAERHNTMLVEAFRNSPYYFHDGPPVNDSYVRLRGVQHQHCSSWTMFRLNMWRGFLQLRRNSMNLWLNVIVMGVIGLCFGILYFQQGGENWRNFVGLHYAMNVGLLYIVPLALILRTPLEWAMLFREYFAGGNAAGPYVLAKILYEFAFVTGPVVLVTLLYWLAGLSSNFVDFLRFSGVVVLITQAASAMAFMVASVSSNALLTLALLPGLITPMVLFSGFLYDTKSLPQYLAWLPRISIVNYGFSSLITLQSTLLPSSIRSSALDFANVKPDELTKNLLVVLAMILTFYFIAYINLKLRLRVATRV